MDKVLSAGTVLNPVKVLNLINLGLGSVTHDSGLGLSTMQSLAVALVMLWKSDINRSSSEVSLISIITASP